LQAEFENYKKQVVRRQTEHLERAAESIVTNLLPVLDAGDNARAHGSQEAAGLGGLLYDTLRKEGLEGLESQPGDGFDPTLHDAVAHEPADEDDAEQEGSVIAEVLREGYTWKGRLLRPAMVRVKG
jgi:molecular chaperone GrpE